MEYPLRAITSAWISKIQLATEYKRNKFSDDADECMQFFNGPHDFMYGARNSRTSRGLYVSGDNVPDPTFRMTVNRVAELVEIFGPVLYHRNPIRQVNPRKAWLPTIDALGDPNNQQPIGMGPDGSPITAGQMIQQQFAQMSQTVGQERAVDKARASLIEPYLNFTPDALDLKSHSRRSINEALIKGMGLLWTELVELEGTGIKAVGSFYDTVDNLYIDPDMETIESANWIARRCIHPVWNVEAERKLEPGSLKGNLESYKSQSESVTDPDADYHRRRGFTNDLLVYFKIWSKMGMGGLLSGVPPHLQKTLSKFGKYCYLEVAEGQPFFLNLPPKTMELLTGGSDSDPMTGIPLEMLRRVQWPTPYWADGSRPSQTATWPFTPFVFQEVPRQVWPMSLLKPAMGEMRAINWLYSFLVTHIKNSCRDFVGVLKAAGEEVKSAVLSGHDLTMIEIENNLGKSIDDVVKFLQHPPINTSVFDVITAIEHNFEKRTGLTELAYAMSSKQMRSAQEAQVKGQQLQIRPDDMANKVEEAMSEIGRKEALAAKYHLEQKDVEPVLGKIGAQWWGKLIMGAEIGEILHDLEFRVEAGSARKPNKDRDAANMNQALQVILPILLPISQQTQNYDVINQLLSDWAKSIDLDPEKYLIKGPSGPTPEQQQMMMQQQQQQQEMQQQQHEAQMAKEQHLMDIHQKGTDLQQQERQHALDLQLQAQQHQQKMGMEMQGQAMDARAQQQSMLAKALEHLQGLGQQEEKHKLAMQLLQEKQQAMKNGAAKK